MFKLFNKFLTKRLLPSYLCQTILDLRSNSFSKFRPPQRLVLNFFSILLIFLLCITQLSCNTTEPPPPPEKTKPTLTLALDDASCTEAWLQLTTKDLELPAQLTLKQYNPTGDSLSQIFILNTQDSLLYIDSLLPNQNYSFQVSSIQHQVSSIKYPVITMDTTSHNFTWQSFEFGQHSSSILYDVAIIDENNIWAVGAIYMNDSLGNPDPHAYNAVHWNGTEWEFKKVYFPTVCGSTNLTSYPAKAIFAFEDGKIWISSSGDKIAIIENGVQINQFCLPSNLSMSINKIWGNSSNDLYVVGNSGNIVHLTRTQFVNTWTKLESGTTSNINDIWGEVDQITGERKILCAVSDISGGGEKKILSINSNNTVDTIKWSINRRIHSIWFKGKHKLYTSGGGVFFQTEKDKWVEQTELPLYFTGKIRGTDYNNIITVGDFGFAAHYNGTNWKVLSDIPAADVLGSISIKNNLIVTTGFNNRRAIIIIGNHF